MSSDVIDIKTHNHNLNFVSRAIFIHIHIPCQQNQMMTSYLKHVGSSKCQWDCNTRIRDDRLRSYGHETQKIDTNLMHANMMMYPHTIMTLIPNSKQLIGNLVNLVHSSFRVWFVYMFLSSMCTELADSKYTSITMDIRLLQQESNLRPAILTSPLYLWAMQHHLTTNKLKVNESSQSISTMIDEYDYKKTNKKTFKNTNKQQNTNICQHPVDTDKVSFHSNNIINFIIR